MSDAFRKSCELIRKLDVLESAGLDESAEADAVRDESDGPWLLLTPDEKLELRRFSESLRTTRSVDLERGGPMKVYVVVNERPYDDVDDMVYRIFARREDADRCVEERREAWWAYRRDIHETPVRPLGERASCPGGPECLAVVESEVHL